jgi:uncharacterized protein (TIGR03437 family)
MDDYIGDLRCSDSMPQRWSLYFLVFAPLLVAQNTDRTVLLRSNLNPRVRRENDRGPVAREMLLSHITLTFQRTPEQHAALDQLLEGQQDATSPNFQHWLTPEEFAARFGVTDETLNRVTTWLRSEGLTVESAARGRGWIVFNGTAAQVQNTFHTEIHRYQVGGKLHFAPFTPPSIPAVFEKWIGAIRGLDDFYLEPTKRTLPLYTAADGTHALVPGDLVRIYDLIRTGVGGEGIAVVGQSAIDLSDIQQFRSTFLLPAGDPQTILVGDDPGIDSTGALQEADSDLEWAGGVSPNSPLLYVYAKDVFDATQQAIDQNLAPVLSFSYGVCEVNVSPAHATALRDLAQQANAQGITWIAGSGDAGAAGCDAGSYPATQGLSVSLPASLPEVTGVGGTEFNEGPGGNWFSNNFSDFSSASQYLPEVAWNDTTQALGLRASGGGASVLYPKPSWQIGQGVPDNGARNVPDLAFTASPNHDPYIVFSGGKKYAAGGTSLAAPVFAGILALTSIYNSGSTPARFGNINPSLYQFAADPVGATAFHDITTGSNIVPCTIGTPDCPDGSLGYSAGNGYDMVTGLGSLKASVFESNFLIATTTTLSASAVQVNEGSPIVLTVKVREPDGSVPAGTVSVYYDGVGGSTLPPKMLDATGTLTFTTTMPGGPHAITALFTGKFPLKPSSSAPISVFVVPLAPGAPILLQPDDKAANAPLMTQLSWSEAQKYASYDVYFGTTFPPPFWGSVTETTCFPAALGPDTTYYWKVVAKNLSGDASSPVRSFTTSGQAAYTVSRVAGTDKTGFSGDGGPATLAQLYNASDVAWDKAGNLYVADFSNRRIRMVTPNGMISTVVGTGASYSGDGGPAIAAGLDAPVGIVFDSQGDLYISDVGNRIREVTQDGIISTMVGGGYGYSADGTPAISAKLGEPNALAVDSADNLYIAEKANNCIRKVAAGVISTVAGQCGTTGLTGDGGPATNATLVQPTGIAFDAAGSLYIGGFSSIRKVSNGIITTVGNAAPVRIAVDASGTVYYTDPLYRIGKFANGVGATVAGEGGGYPADGVLAIEAHFNSPSGIGVDSAGRIVFAEARGVFALSTLSTAPSPVIGADGMTSAAGFAPAPLAPGSIASVFGSFALDPPAKAAGAPLPTTLSGLSIQFQSGSGIAAPLFYASAGQVNLQIPWELTGEASVPVSAMLNGKSGQAQTLTLTAFAPGIFIVNSYGQGAIVDSSYRLVDSSNPAAAGDNIQIFCTGLGAVTNPPATGSRASDTTLSVTTTTPTVMIGGVPATVLFSGLAPGAVGEYQVNVQVPTGVTPGPAVPVTISMANATSNTATIGVQ